MMIDAPILKLHHDLLWHIFSLNADMELDSEDETPALDTLRHCSQVCATWRNLILSSASLWGRVINLDFLRQKEWRAEVMRRTGGSFLHVEGGNVRPSGLLGLEDLTVSLLDDYWARIRSLDLDFTHTSWRTFEGKIWQIFERPTSFLERFRIILNDNEDVAIVPSHIYSALDFVLFGNQAPSLRYFNAPNIKFHFDAPWLIHIRHLYLNVPTPASELLRALAQLPLLEALTDEDSNAVACENLMVSLPQAKIPLLEQIEITAFANILLYADFLQRIVPAGQCCLSFSTCSEDLSDLATTSSLKTTLYRFSRCCDLANSTELDIILHDDHFEFTAELPSNRTFRFDLNLTDTEEPLFYGAINILFSALPSLQFHKAWRLKLAIDAESDCRVPTPTFQELISSVPSIEVLEADEGTIRYLHCFFDDFLASAFPSLREIEVFRCPSTRYVLPLKKFLAARMSRGDLNLTLSIMIDRGARFDLGSFEEFTGLKVVFSVSGTKEILRRYVCGSGQRNKLKIHRDS